MLVRVVRRVRVVVRDVGDDSEAAALHPARREDLVRRAAELVGPALHHDDVETVAFASFLTYSPRGDTTEIRWAKNFVIALKEDRLLSRGETSSALVARRLHERDDVPFADAFLGAYFALVPVSRSPRRPSSPRKTVRKRVLTSRASYSRSRYRCRPT